MAETATTICRICLQQIMEDMPYHFLSNESDLMLQTKLLDFLPEIDLNIIQNPITCSQCTRTINEIHQFKQLCVRTENIIKNLSLQKLPFPDALSIFKKRQLDEIVKEEFVEDSIKNEPFTLQTVEDQCVLINTDIPKCIEESASTEPSYYNYNCNYSTDKKRNFIKHVSTTRNEIMNKYQCHICDYATIVSSNLKRHLRTHTGEKSFSCNICNHRFYQKSHLNEHLRIHTGEKSFFCNVCTYRSNYKSSLQKHLRIHTGEKRCNHRSSLKNHLFNHTKKKLFSCNICDYCSNDKSNLKRHLFTHSEEKLFGCNVCAFRCNDKSSLNRHLRRHTNKS